MKFVLVRHGETEANEKRIYSGWSNYELTEKGRLQIKILAEELRAYDTNRIYASPLGRTMETAVAISGVRNREILVVDNLKEMNFGIFDGKTANEIERDYPEEWKRWIEENETYRMPHGENLQDVIDRVKKFIDTLKDKEGTVIIVSHGGVIQSVITYLLDLDIKNMWHFNCTPAGYVEIDYINGWGSLRKLIPSYI